VTVPFAVTTALACAVTVAAYRVALSLHARTGLHPATTPVLAATALVAVTTVASGIGVSGYVHAARPIHWMLGPATVALAVPVYRNAAKLKGVALAAVAAVLCGSVAAAVTAVGIGLALSASPLTVRSLAPKSITTPIAMAVSGSIGGSPSLTSAFVIVTGVMGAVLAPPVFRALSLRDRRSRGLATGVAAHGIGTARAFAWGELEGSFATLGMGLAGAFVSLVLPWVARYVESLR
jgi:putative effector of murein hydrolase